MTYRLCLASALVGLTSACGNAAGQELDMLRDRHVITRETINSISCRIVYRSKDQSSPDSERVVNGEYWRSGHYVRMRTDRGREHRDHLLRDSKISSTTQYPDDSGTMKRGAQIRQADGFGLFEADAWYLALFSFPVPYTQECFVLERFLDRAVRARAVKVSVSGKEAVVAYLEFEPDKVHQKLIAPGSIRMEIHFDPSKNYVTTGWASSLELKSGGTLRNHIDVIGHREFAPGVYFPTRVEGGTSFEGKQSISWSADFTDVRINEAVSPDKFRMTYVRGMPLTDQIRKVWYHVDEAGNPISEVQHIGPIMSSPPGNANQKPIPDDLQKPGAVPSGKATQDEPARSWWLLWISIGLLALAAVMRMAQRWRTRGLRS